MLYRRFLVMLFNRSLRPNLSYNAQILADSMGPNGVRLLTFLVCMPRFILAEWNTHRVFSRNSASSRAIPVWKRILEVWFCCFVPDAFAANKSGMQAGEAVHPVAQALARFVWVAASKAACVFAWLMTLVGVHKQWANRILEPFMWHHVIVTSTEWDNFFALRISEHAQPEIRTTAALMRAVMDKSRPTQLAAGEWHTPMIYKKDYEYHELTEVERLKVSAGRCAAVSYDNLGAGKDPKKDAARHDMLTTNGHWSPTEHQAQAMRAGTEEQWSGNLRGWRQYRKTFANEAVFHASS